MGHKMFPYKLICRVQAKPSWIRQVLLYPHQLPSDSFLPHLGNLVVPPKAVVLEVESLALKRTCRPHNVIVFFFECIVWPMGSLRLTVLPYVNKFNTFFKTTLFSCPLLHGPVDFS